MFNLGRNNSVQYVPLLFWFDVSSIEMGPSFSLIRKTSKEKDQTNDPLLLLYRRAPPLVSSRHKSIDFTVRG